MAQRHEVTVRNDGEGDWPEAPPPVAQKVRTSYVTAAAMQRPRSIQHALKALTGEALLAGEDFYYGWSAGRDRVEGPSVNLALAAARCWGNCAVESLPVQDLADSWVFTAAFVDLETGFTLSRQFRQSKRAAVGGKLDQERKDDVRFQVGQSKALRNVVLNALPPSLIRAALESAKAGVRQHIEKLVSAKGLSGAVDMALRALAKCGVKEEAVLHKCGVAKREAIGIDHLVLLKGDLTALESGQERADALFPPSEAEAAAPPVPPSQPAPRQEESPRHEEQPAAPRKATRRQLQSIDALGKKLGLTPAHWEGVCTHHRIESIGDADEERATLIIGELTEALAKEEARAAEEAEVERAGMQAADA